MSFSFRPGFIASVVTLVGLAILLNLGGWQLRRAAEKEARTAQRASADANQKPVSTMAQFERIELLQNVVLRGRYLKDYQLFHDNQVSAGDIGVRVLLPFRFDDGGIVLVNQGFLSINSRSTLSQAFAFENYPEVVVGFVDSFPTVGYQLGGVRPIAKKSPKLLTYLVHEQIEQDLGEKLGGKVLLLESEQPVGLSRNWEIVAFGADRHRAYAFQWFSLALALLVIYIAVNLRIGSDSNDDDKP